MIHQRLTHVKIFSDSIRNIARLYIHEHHIMTKNKKKSWKKINIEDVTKFQEDKVLKQIHGDKFDILNPSIPFIEYDICKKSNKDLKKKKDFTSVHDKCLKSRSAVPALGIKQVNSKPIVSSDDDEDIGVTLRHKKLKNYQEIKFSNKIKPDIWSNNDETGKKHNLIKPHVSHSFNLPTAESGMSYNPDKDDYLSLLVRASSIIKKETTKKNKVNKFFDRKCKLMKPKNLKAEMIEMAYGLPTEITGIPDSNDAKIFENENDDDKNEYVIKTIPNRHKMKTRKDRKKKALNKIALEAQNVLSKKKRLLKDINNVNGITKELNKQNDKKNEEKSKILERRIKKMEKLEDLKVNIPIQDIPLPNEITGNLRTIKPQGSMLIDRFQQLYENKFLVSGFQKKYQRKYTHKANHEVTCGPLIL